MVKGLVEEVDKWQQVDRLKKNVVKKLEASAVKTLNTLNLQTKRFSGFREKKDAEMYLIRHKAQKAEEVSDQKHKAKLAQEESRHYKQECVQAK